MKKSLIITASILGFLTTLLLGLVVFVELKPFDSGEKEAQKMLKKLYSAVGAYADARNESNKLFSGAENLEFKEWEKKSEAVIEKWQLAEKEVSELEALSGKISQKENYQKLVKNFLKFQTAKAVTIDQVNAVYDKAPPGQRFEAVAKMLKTDTKTAAEIIKTQNAELAKVWDAKGDRAERLENGARLVKLGCKVSMFVGGFALAEGGVAAMSLIEKGAIIISGADLVLEIGEDSASIALGYNNDITPMFSRARKYTSPAANITGLVMLKTDGADEAIGTYLFGLDQLNSLIQEGSVLGIQVPTYESLKGQKEIEVSKMKPEEVKDWLKKNDLSDKPLAAEEIINQTAKTVETKVEEVTKEEEQKPESIVEKIQSNLPGSIKMKQAKMDMLGKDPIDLSGESFFDLTIAPDNSIKGKYHIGGEESQTAQKTDSASTYASYSGSIEGEVNGKFNPASGEGQGEVTMTLDLETSAGQSSSATLCPNSRIPDSCKFVLTKKGKEIEITIKYGAESTWSAYQFKVFGESS